MKRQTDLPTNLPSSKRRSSKPRDNVVTLRNDAYFDSYSRASIHVTMVTDRARCLSYRRALQWACQQLHRPVVADIGAGSGLLSLWAAQSGASRVYALEAALGAQELCTAMLARNANVLDEDRTVQLVASTVEAAQLPESVDVLVSEWMGHALLYERMLPSVLAARDRWLRPGGLMLPCAARLFLAALRRDEQEEAAHDAEEEEWTALQLDYGGLDFAALRAAARIEEESEAQVTLDYFVHMSLEQWDSLKQFVTFQSSLYAIFLKIIILQCSLVCVIIKAIF